MQIAFDYRGMVSSPMSLEGFPYVDSLDLRFAGNRLLDGRPASASTTSWSLPNLFSQRSSRAPPRVHYPWLYTDHYKRISGVGTPAIRCVRHDTTTFVLFWKVLLLWLIFVLAMSAFLFEPHEIANRLSILTTMFLASAATLFTLQHLPLPTNCTESIRMVSDLVIALRCCNYAFAARCMF